MNKHVIGLGIIWLTILGLFLKQLFIYTFIQEMSIFSALQLFAIVIQTTLTEFGLLTPFLFIILYAIRPLIFFPASIMTLTSVLVFGLLGGFIVSYIGDVCSACLAYYLGKYFGKELGITNRISKTKIGTRLQGNAFLSVLILRLVPIFPFDVVNYASGILKIPFKSYITATLLGIFPGLMIYIFLGYSFLHLELLPYTLSALFLLFIAGFVIKKNFMI